MQAAFKRFGNVGSDVAVTLGATALSIVGPNATSFSLEDIDAHNVIEHDGSLRCAFLCFHCYGNMLTQPSRSDYALGDDHDFNRAYFGQTATYFHKRTIGVTDVAKARLARMDTMKKLNPDFNLTMAGFTGSFVEQSFYLSVFGDPYTAVARSDWVLEWFCELLEDFHRYHMADS